MHIERMGQTAFATIMIAVGVVGLVRGGFAPVWQPVPAGIPMRETLVYLSALVSLGGGLGLLWQRTASGAARVLFAALLAWMVLFRLPVIVHAPLVAVSWEGNGETAVMLTGAWVLYARLAADWDRRVLRFATGAAGMRFARMLYGLAMLAFGMSHFAYAGETAALVPAWLPLRTGWVYGTGSAYIAAGIAVLSGFHARPAATLSALQMGLFTLLVWAPMVAAGGASTFQWNETLVSAALTAGAWVVAGSYCDTHRSATNLRARRRP